MDERSARNIKPKRHYDPWAGLLELLAYLVVLEFDLRPAGDHEPSTLEQFQRLVGWSGIWPSDKTVEAVAKRHPVHAWEVQEEIRRLTDLMEAESNEKRRDGLKRTAAILSRYAMGLSTPVSPSDWPAEREARRSHCARRIADAASVSLWAGRIVANFVADAGESVH